MSIVASNYIQLHIIKYKENISIKSSNTNISDYNLINELEYLVLKRNNKTKIYPNIWQVVTGTIEINETAIQTALREMKEETGLSPIKLWVLPYLAKFYERYSDSVQLSPTFLALVDNNNVKLSSEHLDYSWLNKNDCLNSLYLPSHKEATEIITDFVINSQYEEHFAVDLSKY